MYTEHGKLFHQRPAIELLARESQVPVDGVTRLYENELAKLAVGARIRNFLHIFAIRKVREMLRQHDAGTRPLAADRRMKEWTGRTARSRRGTRLGARLLSHRALPASRRQLNYTGSAFVW
jgi:hypothetical protein